MVPLCACGCGQTVNWHGNQYMKYLNGHNSTGKTNAMFGKKHSKQSRKEMSKTRKAKFASGETKMWCEGLSIKTNKSLQSAAKKNAANKERSKKISVFHKGKKKTAAAKAKMSISATERWKDPVLREHQRQAAVNRINDNGWWIKSKLETKFGKDFLFALNISYSTQFFVPEIKAFYDFYIPTKDVIIETHGDFWHCNPNSKFKMPKYAAQHKNLVRDPIKADWCIKNNKKLLVFWESDINNRPEWVMSELCKHLLA